MTIQDEISSNATGLLFSEEVSPKVLAGSPIWYRLEPNSYKDFGADVKTVSRKPIDPGFQERKGTVVDVDASAHYNTDVTKTNVRRQLRHFFRSDWYEKATTKPWNSAQIAVTGVTTANDRYAVASGGAAFLVDTIAFAAGFGVANNNGVKIVDESAAGYVGTVENLTDEGAPPAAATLVAVGIAFAAGDLALTVTGGKLRLTSTAKANLNAYGIKVNEWHFIGDDDDTHCYAGCLAGFYARVSAVATTYIEYDKVTWSTAANDAGAAKTIHVFFGEWIKNEKLPANQVIRTGQFERTLGSDGTGIQSEIVLGGNGEELTIFLPTADKLTADMSYMGLDVSYRTGTEGPLSAVGGATIIDAPNEDAINSSSDVYRVRTTILDATTLQPTQLFVYFEGGSFKIKNNYKTRKAVSVVGGFKNSPGTFNVMGEGSWYFGTVASVSAVRNNVSCTWDAIVAVENMGYVWDMPLLTAETKGLDVKLNESIMVPLKQAAFEGPNGHTFGLTYFPYLPNRAMA